ncbi:MAG: SET domain-containing protein-lysine N-methyltransferase, partial [Candidatus Vogelbacteria bacterium]|nr:SET domain-containing protein-lysine N-methyltransferase [Candidatus Vogelbacteria bacterium]
KFLFYGFGPIYYYDSWLADRYECMHTHLDTEFFWTRWKYFLGKIAESGSTSFVNPKEAKTLSTMFWPWRVDESYTGSMTFANGERFVFVKCEKCKKLVDMPDYIQVYHTRNGQGLFTNKRLSRNEWMFQFGGVVKDEKESTVMSLQIDNDKFLETQSIESTDNFLNHSCDPNCYIDWDSMWLRAKRDIYDGEELTYDYNTSDWDNLSLKRKEPAWFICQCGSGDCLRKMLGFKHLDKRDQERRLPLAAPYIRKNMEPKIST